MNTGNKLNSPLGQIIRNSEMIEILKPGDLKEGTLIEKTSRAAYFDLGVFSTGIVYGSELSRAGTIIKKLNIGEKITAKVIDSENENGYVELSLSEADAQKNWDIVKDLSEKGEILGVKILGANSGGLLAEINNLKAFLPVSQLSADNYPRVDDGRKERILEELKKLVGQELKVKIIDVKPRVKKLIISEREIMQENNKELLNKYEAGNIIDGIISGVTDFGAFMKFADNPQLEGLIHISELDHKLIENPKEIVKIGDSVKVKIVEIKNGRVSLSLKALKPDPWEKILEQYKEGQEIFGKVLKFNPFGAFIALNKDIQGLIHISEFNGDAEEMKKTIKLGDSYEFKIETMKPLEKRIMLKLKK